MKSIPLHGAFSMRMAAVSGEEARRNSVISFQKLLSLPGPVTAYFKISLIYKCKMSFGLIHYCLKIILQLGKVGVFVRQLTAPAKPVKKECALK
jgi:hypothetical protein